MGMDETGIRRVTKRAMGAEMLDAVGLEAPGVAKDFPDQRVCQAEIHLEACSIDGALDNGGVPERDEFRDRVAVGPKHVFALAVEQQLMRVAVPADP